MAGHSIPQNPYMRPSQLQMASMQHQQYNSLAAVFAAPVATYNQLVVESESMGIQSQQREGAVKNCKKRATKAKHKQYSHAQRAIDGGVAFDPLEHCIVCKAVHLNTTGIETRTPKRAHHKACQKTGRQGVHQK